MAVLFGIGTKQELATLKRLGFKVSVSTEQELNKAFRRNVELQENTVFLKIFLDKWSMSDIIGAVAHLQRNENESIVSKGEPARGRKVDPRLCGSSDVNDSENGFTLRLVRD